MLLNLLLNIFFLGCIISTNLCLIPVIKSIICNEDTRATLFSSLILLSLAFMSNWFGIYFCIKYKLEENRVKGVKNV